MVSVLGVFRTDSVELALSERDMDVPAGHGPPGWCRWPRAGEARLLEWKWW